MNKKIIIPIIVVLILAIAGTATYLLLKLNQSNPLQTEPLMESVPVEDYNFNHNTEYTLDDLINTETDEMGIITGTKPDGQLGSVFPEEIEYVFNGEGLDEYVEAALAEKEPEVSTSPTITTPTETPATEQITTSEPTTSTTTADASSIFGGSSLNVTSEQLQAENQNRQDSGMAMEFNSN